MFDNLIEEIKEYQENEDCDFLNDTTCGIIEAILCTRFDGTRVFEYMNALFAVWFVSGNNPLNGSVYKSAKIIWDSNSREWDMSR